MSQDSFNLENFVGPCVGLHMYVLSMTTINVNEDLRSLSFPLNNSWLLLDLPSNYRGDWY